MQELWNDFEAWLQENFTEGYDTLNPGATEQELVELENAIGARLPDDYRLCLQIHNGQKPDTVGLLHSNEFLSTQGCLAEWKIWKGLLDDGQLNYPSEPSHKDAIQTNWWNPLWLPITADGGGNHECLDLAPAKNGNYGQIISMDHATVHRDLLSNNFASWFAEYVKAVVANEYAYSEDYGRLMPREEI